MKFVHLMVSGVPKLRVPHATTRTRVIRSPTLALANKGSGSEFGGVNGRQFASQFSSKSVCDRTFDRVNGTGCLGVHKCRQF